MKRKSSQSEPPAAQPGAGAAIGQLARLSVLLMLFSASGATCQRPILTNPFGPAVAAAPEVLPEGATRDQIIAAINHNSAKIKSIDVTGATITVPDTFGLPLLSANIAAERPRRFRLTAGTAITGQEVDLGSNDELFWLWVRHNQPPAVYLCRHDQFTNSAIRQMMPVEPSWLLSALGMTDIDPAQVFEGPTPRGAGKVEFRTWLPSASGRLQRVLLVDSRRAWVLEQHIYDQSGTTHLASAVAETHRYYPIEQISLPDRIALRLPPANIAMTIDLGTVQINQLGPDRSQLWTMPAFEGYPQHDLGGAPAAMAIPGRLSPAPQNITPASYPQYPSTNYPTTYPTNAAPQVGGPQVSTVNQATYMPLPRYGERPRVRRY